MYGINFHNVPKFTVHDQHHDCVRPLREHPFYRDLPSVIRMQVCRKTTSVRGEQDVTIAPFSAFHLKSLASVHDFTSKGEGIVIIDMTVDSIPCVGYSSPLIRSFSDFRFQSWKLNGLRALSPTYASFRTKPKTTRLGTLPRNKSFFWRLD